MSSPESAFWDFVRSSIIGAKTTIRTPFGTRRITYADYTASGRGVAFIEDYLRRIMEEYANSHTDDDATGLITTVRLRQAEAIIKRLVHAGPEYKIIEDGAGTTGAVHRLQQILGVYIPPVAKEFFRSLLERTFTAEEEYQRLRSCLLENRPVVFVGPYEHHSNEVSWRECYSEVVEIELDSEGLLDLKDLEARLSSPQYRGRRKIGAFSAASNVSGVKTRVYEVAEILHCHGALAFFDFAASAPYDEIDVCRDQRRYFDGIYFSPHKFLGGPGSCGLLIIHEKVYRRDLPPTVGAGGTVEYVSPFEQTYSTDIEDREKPGTPAIVQVMRAALAMQLKQKLGQERIAAREHELIRRVFQKFASCTAVEVMGSRNPDLRLAIFSFTLRCGDAYFHPRFVSTLLNDLFGIQTRAGCSCAGPYGHRVLHIDAQRSLKYKERLLEGYSGIKPGWTRISLHYLTTDEELEFILEAICFVCEHGKYFLPSYRFDLHTGAWQHKEFSGPEVRFGLEEALRAETGSGPTAGSQAAPAGAGSAGGSRAAPAAPAAPAVSPVPYGEYLRQAAVIAEALKKDFRESEVAATDRELIPYVYVETTPPREATTSAP